MNNQCILVIDDEPQIRRLLEITLESNDFSVISVDRGKLGLSAAASNSPDLILLDLGLPDISGHDVLKELRLWYNKPIIILSVQNSEKDIVDALDSGANDYVTKPFRTIELLARIRSNINRTIKSENAERLMRFSDIEIDIPSRIVKKDELIIKLTNTEFNLLALLAKNEGRVLTHQYILKEIWGLNYQNETQYLRVFVGSLRKKIESDPNRSVHIITESGVGYRFM